MNQMEHQEKKDAIYKSLKKAMDLLDFFTLENPTWSISDLSRASGLYKSNIYSILTTLAVCGYIEQEVGTEKYRLGTKLLTKSNVVLSYMNELDVIHNALKEISEQVPEWLFFAILRSDEVLYLDSYILPKNGSAAHYIKGRTAPIYCTGIGKALYSACPDGSVSLPDSPFQSYTPNTITTLEDFLEDIRKTRERGYSIDNMEHEYGIKCVGVPIFNHHGQLFGAISASGPSLRFTQEKMVFYATVLMEKAIQLKLQL